MAKRTKSEKRIRRTGEEIQLIVSDYQNSGQTQADYAQSHGLALSTLTNWLRRQRRQGEAKIQSQSARFVEVSPPRMVGPQLSAAEADFELVYDQLRGDGLSRIKIKGGFEREDLRNLLEVLDHPQRK